MSTKRFDTLLIANRGEIVVRVAATARRLGLRTVAIASDADRDAPHTRACELCVPIGGERPADSYLRIDAVLDAARRCGAQAVHPGYGFLSENAAFADAVIAAGLVWVGPSPVAMRAMGDKAAARCRMAAAGVPVLPGYDDEAQDAATLQQAAQRVGLPLMIKAAAGGGGRGMRRVDRAEDFAAALQAAQSEAMAAFGDGRVLLERAVIAPRHVEVQVFADAHGHLVHLGERDCSVQRRHQKLLEEAPSPAVTPALRRRLGEAAVRVARDIGYLGAGTVEFLLEGEGDDARFWFMEMNTRLQVEHPVTEALTGTDLVEWQLRVARGEPLPVADQTELLRRYESGGHAIEARLCAEDPADDHLPGAGTVQRWRAPEGVRCDHAMASGWQVSPFYDSMLAKLIAHKPTREPALDRLACALDATVCLGLPTNRRFLARVLRSEPFRHGPVTTAFLQQHPLPPEARPAWLQALASATITQLPRAPLPALWTAWRVPGASAAVANLRWERDDRVAAILDGRPVQAWVVRDGMQWWFQSEGIELAMEDRRLQPSRTRDDRRGGREVIAPMHGRVVQLLVEPGQAVQAGALVAVIEAMKMEHRLTAPATGAVRAVHVRTGEQVAARRVLVELEV
jgi:geranyl-CoA carboxylase alpha subunit